MHFINFSHKVFQTDPEVIVKIFSKVCPSSYISFGGYYSTEASDAYDLRVCCNNDECITYTACYEHRLTLACLVNNCLGRPSLTFTIEVN